VKVIVARRGERLLRIIINSFPFVRVYVNVCFFCFGVMGSYRSQSPQPASVTDTTFRWNSLDARSVRPEVEEPRREHASALDSFGSTDSLLNLITEETVTRSVRAAYFYPLFHRTIQYDSVYARTRLNIARILHCRLGSLTDSLFT
jgi:hypothetical protein